MPGVALQHNKRILVEATEANQNTNAQPDPPSAKRRKLDLGSSTPQRPSVRGGKSSAPGSSNPKSQFEQDVLEKLTQDISELKQKNSERDQQWDRPPLVDFDEKRDDLRFQQIEAERGNLTGGDPVVRLFGVTEVSALLKFFLFAAERRRRTAILFYYM